MKKIVKFSLFLVSAILLMGMFAITSCKDDEELPKIDGYDNSDQVAATYLKAHWTFDNTYAEAISTTEPENKYGGYAFEAGQIGSALKLTEGAIVYPSIANIGAANSLGDFTVTTWVKISNNGNSFTSLFGIIPTAATDVWGNIGLNFETGWRPATNDTIVPKANYLSLNQDGSLNGQDNRPDPFGNPKQGVFKQGGQWCFVAIRFNSATHKLQVFGNGVSIGKWDDRGPNTVALNMRVPCKAVFGSLAASDIGFSNAGARGDWMKKATASVDDLRVFNTAISDAEIMALYNLGVAGR